MPKIEKTITIDAPVETVFARLEDPRINLEIAPATKEVRDISGQGLGMRFVIAMGFMGTTLDLDCEYTEYVPNQRFVLHWKGAFGDMTSTLSFEAEDGGTRWNYICEFKVTAPVLGKFAEPVVGKLLSQNIGLVQANAKALIEAENPSS